MLTLLSRLFDPVILISIVVFLAAFRSLNTPLELTRFIAVYILVMVLPPIVMLYQLIQQKKVSSWDISNRTERIRVLSGFLVLLLVDCVLVGLMGSGELRTLFLMICLWFIGFYMVTLRFKLSGHTGMLTFVLCILTTWYGWQIFPMFALIPIMAWVRVKRRNHTVGQVVVGSIYSILIIFLVKMINFQF